MVCLAEIPNFQILNTITRPQCVQKTVPFPQRQSAVDCIKLFHGLHMIVGLGKCCDEAE